jgi:hypothetical protein
MQKYSSKNTSINTTRLPAVYNNIYWGYYNHSTDNYHIVDIGCGQLKTQHMIKELLNDYGIKHFYPWDPYHECIVNKIKTLQITNNADIRKVIVCSNVLNVIDNDKDLNTLIRSICDMSVINLPDGTYRMNPVYITVYEGDKSGVGRETKKDCWQRNERLSAYLERFNNYIKKKYNHNANFFKTKYGMIIGATQYGGHITYEA